jgi:hypothetical protein
MISKISVADRIQLFCLNADQDPESKPMHFYPDPNLDQTLQSQKVDF